MTTPPPPPVAARMMSVRIQRPDSTWTLAPFHTLTDEQLAAYAANQRDADGLGGWKLARRLAKLISELP